ncbi:nuclear transport factor 2 family protein [Rhodococcus sp. NPDC127530]|uniref:nuclear transport factor 2 family protein n=1 Tax=unclassified Rhodococcus (in: high G+C Gram-positive bacteria) TaxID=192944 RepID=UPI00363BA1F2
MTAPVRADLLEAYRSMYRGMIERDTSTLATLLDDGYTLTHMTGYVQTGAEWLEQIASGEMRYFSARERDTSIKISGDSARVVGRSVVDASIWGSRGTWNLQLAAEYRLRSGRWIATLTVASTF